MTHEIDPRENKNQIGDHSARSEADEPVVFIDAIEAVEKVGEISPIILIAGILIGLLLFVLIAGGLIAFILNGGFGLVGDIPTDPVIVNFDSTANSPWQELKLTGENGSGNLIYAREASFVDGRYQMTNRLPNQAFWATAGIDLAAGDYGVDVTFKQPPTEVEVGAGIIFFVSGNEGEESFYLFEIDPDGFVWIGRCEAACAVATPLTGNGWYAVEALKLGAGETNRLSVNVGRSDMVFYINDIEVGYVGNLEISGWGDVGFLVELVDGREATAEFDNFSWSPPVR